MANSAIPEPLGREFERESAVDRVGQVRSLGWKIAGATLVLMAIGSATRVTNAGLACPDWPLCYGSLIPAQQMNLRVFLEWFHRLDAAAIGFATLFLAGKSLWYRRSLPRWVPWMAIAALTLILLQGLLGGLTVTELLRFDIVTAHLGFALLFFTTILCLSLSLMPHQGTGTAGGLKWLGAIAALLVYGQSLLGALVGSRWALHQCLELSQLCGVANSHLFGVAPPTIAILVLFGRSWFVPNLHPLLRRLANLSAIALVAQITLGVATFYLHLQVEPLTVAHQATGATLLGILVAFAVLAWRDGSGSLQPQMRSHVLENLPED